MAYALTHLVEMIAAATLETQNCRSLSATEYHEIVDDSRSICCVFEGKIAAGALTCHVNEYQRRDRSVFYIATITSEQKRSFYFAEEIFAPDLNDLMGNISRFSLAMIALLYRDDV